MQKSMPQSLHLANSAMRVLKWLPVSAVVALTLNLSVQYPASQGELSPVSAKTVSVRTLGSELLPDATATAIEPLVEAGVWSLPGSNWRFANEIVSTERLDHALQVANQSHDVGSDLAEHVALIDLIPSLRAQVDRQGALTTRSIDFGSSRAAVTYRELAGRTYLISLRLAHRQSEAHWQLITLLPHHNAARSEEHLLPLDATNTCQRLNEAGQLQCEIVETTQAIEALCNAWTLQGWHVRPLITADDSQSQFWSCTNAKQSVHVRAHHNPHTSKTTLVMTVQK